MKNPNILIPNILYQTPAERGGKQVLIYDFESDCSRVELENTVIQESANILISLLQQRPDHDTRGLRQVGVSAGD